MKYYVIRTSLITGRLDYLLNPRTKAGRIEWCSKAFKDQNPDKVHQFTKQGAKAICDRATDTWSWIYEAIPVTAFN